MLRFCLSVTVFALLVAGGLVHGVWSNRWHDPFQDRAAELNRLPMTIGDWDGRAGDNDVVPPAQRTSSLVRFYSNRANGNVVSIYLTYGPKGPLCFNHTPLGCYPSNGYTLIGEPTKYPLDRDPQHPAEFWVA